MLDRLRRRLDSYLGAVGSVFASLLPSPTGWTLTGLLASILAGIVFATNAYGGEILGGVLVLVAGFFDVVDGAVARAAGRATKRGAFLDSTMDRVGEVGIFVGILVGADAGPLIVLLALAASLLVSYTRAKGDSLGVTLSGVGVGERSERMLILAIASLLGLTGWGVLIVAIVASYTFIERTFRAAKALSQGGRSISAISPMKALARASSDLPFDVIV